MKLRRFLLNNCCTNDKMLGINRKNASVKVKISSEMVVKLKVAYDQAFIKLEGFKKDRGWS